MGKGLTGWLSPDGEFFECEYGEHYLLAEDLSEKDTVKDSVFEKRRELISEGRGYTSSGEALKNLQWIPMGIPKWGSRSNMDYLFINYVYGWTESQSTWLYEHFEELSEHQQNDVMDYIDGLKDIDIKMWERKLK